MSNDIPFECASCQAAIKEFFEHESTISTHPFSQFQERYESAALHIYPIGRPGCSPEDFCGRCFECWVDKENEYDNNRAKALMRRFYH